jgi:HEAT repeat protein
MREQAAVNPLCKLLYHHSEPVKMEAALALGKIGGSKAVEALIKVVVEEHENLPKTIKGKDVGTTAESLMVGKKLLEAAGKSLGETGDSRAIKPLLMVLGDRYSGVASNYRELLKFYGSYADRPGIELDIDYFYRIFEEALEKLFFADKTANSILDKLLNDRKQPEHQRDAAREALNKIQSNN